MIAGLAIEEWILPYHTVGMQLYNHLLPPTTVPASAFSQTPAGLQLRHCLRDFSFRICHVGTEFTSNGHRFHFLSIPLPPVQESEPGWRLVLLCIPPPSRETETLTSAAWILISFLQNSCYVVCLWCWGLNFPQRSFHAVPSCLSVHSINNFPNKFFAHNNPSKCPLEPKSEAFKYWKKNKSLQRV